MLAGHTPIVFPNQENCLNSVPGEFSWRCSLDAQYEKFNPISFDISTTEKQQIVIGMVGEVAIQAEHKEQETRAEEMANERCMSEFGNDRYFDDPEVTNHFPSVALFKKWITKIIDNTPLSNFFTSATEQVIDNSFDHKLKDHMLQMLQKFCETKLKYAKYLGSMCHKTLPVADTCSKKYCQKLKAEGKIQGSCPNGFDLTSDRDFTFDEIFSINPFVSLCLTDEWFVCEKGDAKVFKDINAYTSPNSGFMSFSLVEKADIENNLNNKEYHVSTSTESIIIQPIMVLPNLTLDNATNFVWNLEITGNGGVLFGIVDISAWDDYTVWEELVYGIPNNTIGFFFDRMFKLHSNINGEFAQETSKYGGKCKRCLS